MNTDCVLSLLQSFVINARKARFPEQPLCLEKFAAKRPGDTDICDIWEEALANLRAMLMLKKMPALRNETMAEIAHNVLRIWEGGDRRVAFRTSGTTGKPKICIHSEADLNTEADFLKPFFEKQSLFISAVPAHHMYGFTFGLYLPYVLKRQVERRAPLPSIFYSSLREKSAGIGIPHIYETGIPPPAPEETLLVCASSPVSDETLLCLENAGYGILDIFGSSETGVFGYRRHAGNPYELAPYYERHRGNVFRRNASRPLQLMDRLDWRDERHFYPCGRIDQLRQVGGINVSTQAVERKLSRIAGVASCAVRPMRPEEGKRLKAFIVPVKGICRHKLQEAIFLAIQDFPVEERPGKFSFGSELPKNSMGKLSDW